MSQTRRPALAPPRQAPTLEAVRSSNGGWDVDAYHAMSERDEALLADEIINGATSSAFVYQFSIQGTDVAGISVIGAQHLAYHYGGLKHRVIASVQKNAELFTFTTYPHDGQPMQVSCSAIRELADQPDFYEVLVEVLDVKNGNSIQMEKREYRFEKRRDGTEYERPHYRSIALAKARRNAFLSLIPADVQLQWRNKMVGEKKVVNITASVIDEKRHAVLRFAAKQGLLVDRRAVEELTLDQIAGLGDAARSENQMAFVNAARALKLDVSLDGGEEADVQGEPQREAAPNGEAQQPVAQPRRGRPRKGDAAPQTEPETTQESADPQNADASGATHPASTEGSQEQRGEGSQNSQDGPGPTATNAASPSERPAAPSRGLMLDFC